MGLWEKYDLGRTKPYGPEWSWGHTWTWNGEWEEGYVYSQEEGFNEKVETISTKTQFKVLISEEGVRTPIMSGMYSGPALKEGQSFYIPTQEEYIQQQLQAQMEKYQVSSLEELEEAIKEKRTKTSEWCRAEEAKKKAAEEAYIEKNNEKGERIKAILSGYRVPLGYKLYLEQKGPYFTRIRLEESGDWVGIISIGIEGDKTIEEISARLEVEWKKFLDSRKPILKKKK